MGYKCPNCGSKFTYVNSQYLVCRSCGARSPLQNQPRRNPNQYSPFDSY